MRGRADEQTPLCHTLSVGDRMRRDHPPRAIKRRVDRLLGSMSPQWTAAYSAKGRPSVPPERLLKAPSLTTL